MKIILGIDPGSRITGYGVIKTNGMRHEYVSCGSIYLPEDDLSVRLKRIFDELTVVILQHQPHEVAIEQVFVHQNPSTALKLGQARGAAIVAAATQTLPVAEYSARQVKQSIVGYGAATKIQIQHMITRLLNLNAAPQTDAADALAIALSHATMSFGLGRFSRAKRRSTTRRRK